MQAQHAERLSAAAIIRGADEIIANEAASLRDFGDGVAVFEIHRKMNCFVPDVLDVFEAALEMAGDRYRAMVVASADSRVFSAGADLNFFVGTMEKGHFDFLESYIRRGQHILLGTKYCSVPVVAAVHGVAVGAGCELILHADAVVAHAEARIGLPEASLGVIPGWGGCTQALLRAQERLGRDQPMAAVSATFDLLRTAFVSASGREAQERGLLRPNDRIVMHPDDLLSVATGFALSRSQNYEPPARPLIGVPGRAGYDELMSAVQDAAGRASKTDHDVAHCLAWILTGGELADPSRLVSEEHMMRLELDASIRLLRSPRTLERMVQFVRTRKPLRK